MAWPDPCKMRVRKTAYTKVGLRYMAWAGLVGGARQVNMATSVTLCSAVDAAKI